MANWSYNGTVLPDFPTEYGSYTDQYTYRAIVWEQQRQCWFAVASANPFVMVEGSGGRLLVKPTGPFGEYRIDMGETDWRLIFTQYTDLEAWDQDGSYGYRPIWVNYDLINQADGSVYLAENVPVSPDSVITGLTVNAAQLRLNRGEAFQFAAKVEGTEVYSDRVDYTLRGNDAGGGTTLSRDGLLTVGETEHSSTFTVTVTSRQDSTVTQTVTVTVADYQSKLSMRVVTDLCDYNGVVMPEFPADYGEYSDKYIYRAIVWEQKRQRWYALASAQPFDIRNKSGRGLGLYTTSNQGQYYLPVGGTAWVYVANDISSGFALYFGDDYGYKLVWANHDIISRVDGSVVLEESEPVRLCSTVGAGEETAYHITGSTVWLDGSCIHLNTTEPVYTVKVWLYRLVDGLNTTLPPTWTSEAFGGPNWAQRIALTDLMAFTRYGIYAVVCVDGAATDHHWQGYFTTMQTDTALGLAVEAEEIRSDGFTLAVIRHGLDAEMEYIAEITVYHPNDGRVAFVGEISFYGDGRSSCVVTDLEPNKPYAVAVAVYPAPVGAVLVRGEYSFTTAPEKTGWNIYAGISGLARQVRAVYVGANGRARRVKGIYLGVDGRAQPL